MNVTAFAPFRTMFSLGSTAAAYFHARTFALRFTPVREGSGIIGALAVARDSTEEDCLRHEMARREEWFRSLIKHSRDMTFQVRADGVLEYASPSVDRILGYDHT